MTPDPTNPAPAPQAAAGAAPSPAPALAPAPAPSPAPAPAPGAGPDLVHRIFAGASTTVRNAIGAAEGAVHAIESNTLFVSLEPDLKSAYEKLLPPALAAGEKAIADLVPPAEWSRILAGIGALNTAYVQGVLGRISAAVAAKALAAAGATVAGA